MCLIFSYAELVLPGYPLAESFWSSELDIEVWNWIKIACVYCLPHSAALCLEVTATMVLEGVCLTEPGDCSLVQEMQRPENTVEWHALLP